MGAMEGIQASPNGQNKAARPRVGVGFRVGMLTAAEPTPQRRNGYIVWRCVCDCGGEALLDTRCLQRGSVRDCGCITPVKPGQKDITGQRFGRLTAVEPTGEALRGSAVWRCVCDCGGEVLAPLHQLCAGYRKSCGCLSHPPRKDLIGKRFGRLTVTEYAGKQNGMHRWRCVCDCGGETVAGQTLLQAGKTKSCGCLQAEIYKDNLKLIDGTSVTILEAVRRRPLSANSSGYTGVYWDGRRGKWLAQIGFQGKSYRLGAYFDKQQAVAARRRGAEMHDAFLERYYAEHPDTTAGPKQISKQILEKL